MKNSRNKAMAFSSITLASALLLVGCGSGQAESASSTTVALLELPAIDTANGLEIDGEQIADKELFEAAKESSVNYYSGLGGEAEQLLADRFMEETGIQVSFDRMPTNKLLERILSEKGAGKLSVDFVRVTDLEAAEQLAKAGVYAKSDSPFLDEYEAEDAVFDDEKVVSGFSSPWGMTYNAQKVSAEDAPTNWTDLADPKWKGRIGLTQVSVGGYAASLTDFQIQHYGEEYLQGVSDNEPRFFDSVAVQTEALARGEIDVAVMGLSNSLALELAGAPVKSVIPEDGMSTGLTPMGLTSTGVDNPAAQVFMSWQMSKSGQSFAAAQGYAPTRSDVQGTTALGYEVPQSGTEKLDVFTQEEQEDRQAEVLATWKRIFNY